MAPTDKENYTSKCPSGGLCSRLPAECIECNYYHNCTYGKPAAFTCKPRKGVHCIVSSTSYCGCILQRLIFLFHILKSARQWKSFLFFGLCDSQGESGQQESHFLLSITCQFCWQLDPAQYRCSNSTNCMTVSCPRQRYNATCDVLEHVHCLGKAVDLLTGDCRVEQSYNQVGFSSCIQCKHFQIFVSSFVL